MRRLPYLLRYVRVELLVHTIRSTTWDAMTWPRVREQIPGGANLRAALVALRIKQDEPELRFVHRRGVAPRHAFCCRAAS